MGITSMLNSFIMLQKFSSILEETIDLKKVIRRIIKNNNVEKIYLFGSRAFKTGSSRSDIDLILCGNNIDSSFIDDIYSRYNALDLFKGCETYIISTISGSEIRKTENFSSLFTDQLRAVLLWSKEDGYINEEYYLQKHYIGQRHNPSGRPQTESFEKLKQLINNPMLTSNCQFCFQEALVDYTQECYLSCVSLLGLSCEYLLQDLIAAYRKKCVNDGTEYIFDRDITNCRNAKPKLEKLEEYIKLDMTFFNSVGFKKLTEYFIVFNIVRMYRNDADHPNQYQFTSSECNALFSSLCLGLEEVLRVTKFLNDNYS